MRTRDPNPRLGLIRLRFVIVIPVFTSSTCADSLYIFQDTEVFVRVVSCLACDLTMNGLACDPPVFVLPAERLTGKNEYIRIPVCHRVIYWR
jgi:hypothetical protein